MYWGLTRLGDSKKNPKGPVIGPLVIAGIIIEEKRIEELNRIGVRDSKLLSKKRREKLFVEIKKIVKDYKFLIVEPYEIDKALNSLNLNLNKLEAIKLAQIINYLNPDKAIIDCPSANTHSFKNYLKMFLKNKDTEIHALHDADKRFVVVGAASIIAKVIRDKEIEKLKKEYGDFGSGYPSDPKTIDFLEKHAKKDLRIFRKSWSTFKRFKT